VNNRESTALLELLRDRYPFESAPVPSPALMARMDAGGIRLAAVSAADTLAAPPRRAAVVRRFSPLRLAAAATVTMFVATGGLATVGALPNPIQRGIASAVSTFDIDLPSPGGGSGSTPDPAGRPPTSNADDAGTDHAGSPPATSPAAAPGTGADTGGDVPTTLPGGVAPPTGLPPLTLPPITLPPVTLPPSIQLPIPGLPPITLPSLPPITLPPLFP
jgi:hypothetical protein